MAEKRKDVSHATFEAKLQKPKFIRRPLDLEMVERKKESP